MKTLSTKSAELRKGVTEIGSSSKAECDKDKLDGNGMDNVEIDGGKVGDNEIGKKG